MSHLSHLNKAIPLFIVTIVFACFALLPVARAVVPAPDGGYPSFTTAEGQNALFSLTSGAANTAVGWFSLNSDTTGGFNTGIGAGTLVLNTGDENTAIGTAALLLNTASGNTAVGSRALLNNTTGGTLEQIGQINVGPNVAVGSQALQSNATTSANTAVGYQALASFTTGVGGSDVGCNTAVGFQVLANATTGAINSGFGYQALFNNTQGTENVAMGWRALFSNTTAGGNTAIGFSALHDNTGVANTAVGSAALGNNITGDFNIALGGSAGSAVTTASNVICIGTDVFGANVSDRCFIGNIYSNVQPIVGTNPDSVTITMSGRLGRGNVSSRRYKHDIQPMDNASEVLYALKPVSFRYNKEYDETQTLAFGLIAEDVAEVYPDLVGRNADGQPESVRYQQINAMLLNEFLKEHSKVQELEATVAQQRKNFESRLAQQEKQIESLTTGLQKVSTELELSRPTPQVVNNH